MLGLNTSRSGRWREVCHLPLVLVVRCAWRETGTRSLIGEGTSDGSEFIQIQRRGPARRRPYRWGIIIVAILRPLQRYRRWHGSSGRADTLRWRRDDICRLGSWSKMRGLGERVLRVVRCIRIRVNRGILRLLHRGVGVGWIRRARWLGIRLVLSLGM